MTENPTTTESTNPSNVLADLFWLIDECEQRCLSECSRWYYFLFLIYNFKFKSKVSRNCLSYA